MEARTQRRGTTIARREHFDRTLDRRDTLQERPLGDVRIRIEFEHGFPRYGTLSATPSRPSSGATPRPHDRLELRNALVGLGLCSAKGVELCEGILDVGLDAAEGLLEGSALGEKGVKGGIGGNGRDGRAGHGSGGGQPGGVVVVVPLPRLWVRCWQRGSRCRRRGLITSKRPYRVARRHGQRRRRSRSIK